MVKSVAETKYFDQVTAVNPTQAGTLTNISDITRGDEVTQRVGNEVFLKMIEFRMSFLLNSNVTRASVRYMVVVDTMGYNAPTPSDVLEAGLLSTAYADIAPYTWDYRKRFIVKVDKVVGLVQGAKTQYCNTTFTVPLNMKSYNIGAGTTFKNQVYLMLLGTEGNVLNLSTIYYSSRLHFTDL